ncbi:MAG: hypothetical protein ACYTGW_22450 [Planctomycetota bacterium]
MISVCSTLGLALLSPVALAQTLQLRDGTLLVGKVQEASGDRLVFERLDNGGTLRLRWDQLTKASADRIKAKEGLLVENEEVITVTADVLQFSPGGIGLREIVGRIVSEDDTSITVRRRGSRVPVQRSTIKGRSQRQVPPSEIFTTDEYYHDLFQQMHPGDDADKHIALADKLLKVRDYSHAELHLLKADELGGGRQPQLLKAKLSHLGVLKESAAEQQLLDEIRTWQNRGNFNRAMSKLAEFKQRFPDTKLRGDLERTEARLIKTRESHYVRKVAKLWYRTIGRLAKSKAGERNLALADARSYCEREMGKDIREHIAMTLEIEADEVESLWAKRLEHRGAMDIEQYYYGVGSWVLGDEAIIKDTRQAKAEEKDEKKKSQQDQELERLRKRIQEAIRRARRSGPTAGGDKKKEITPDAWWEEASRDVRASFIRAYYVENSEDLEIVNAYLDNCPNCGGRGKIQEQMSTGQAQLVKCGVCHGTRFKRRIRAK